MKRTKKQSVTCNYHVETITDSTIRGDVFLRPNTTYMLTIDYPLSNPAVIAIRSGKNGMGTNVLLGKICKAYAKVYAREDNFLGDDPPYGIWGHALGDLVIEGIYVNHEKKIIRIDVGS